jgi:hypothetical protein
MDQRAAVVREGFVREDVHPQSQPAPGPRAIPQEEPAPPQVAETPARPVETWPIKVKLLHKPVVSPDLQQLRELTFREPTGADVNRFGNPTRINGDGDIIVDERKMTLMMAALSGLIPSSLDKMDPRDWNSCAYRLRGFFLPEPEAW